ncbi:MAG: TetR/AcrR family transcriptional regulator [Gemmatimonadetes bacterium]|nr:TetR/AcrR family transcriptional regulator [Gemmatimonadota bacterium]
MKPSSLRRPPASHSARVREKRVRRSREILHAARVAFRERGYHGTTLDDIAARLGVQKTALYHYFPDKETILYTCHWEALEEVEQILGQALQREASSAARLRYVIKEHVRVMTETLEGSPLTFETTALSPTHAAQVIQRRDRYENGVRALIEQGIAQGEFRRVNSKIAAFAIFGAINWIARWYRPEGSLHAEELGSQFADHLTGGLTCQ